MRRVTTPIADASSSSEEEILLEGTVVFASGVQAVLQDDTGGIRLAFQTALDLVPGDILVVTGSCIGGGFQVQGFEKTDTGPLPAQESTLQNAKEAVRVLVRGVVLGSNTVSQGTCSYTLVGTKPDGLSTGDRVDIWGVILDGRDIGTVVFPDAELKIFVTASAEIRAQRRYDELTAKGEQCNYDDILKNVKERDYIDSHREISPLTQAKDAIVLDNSNMTINEQQEWLLKLTKEAVSASE